MVGWELSYLSTFRLADQRFQTAEGDPPNLKIGQQGQ
jgi:hypothetical protein